MKHYLFIIVLLSIIILEIHAHDSFCGKELSLTELMQNNFIFDRIKNELQGHIQAIDESIGINQSIEIELDNFEYIFEINNNIVNIFLIMYSTGYPIPVYFSIFVVTDNNMTEIKIIEIKIINFFTDVFPIPLDAQEYLPPN
jgi:hypothetical protein